jgi:hypothetical protein
MEQLGRFTLSTLCLLQSSKLQSLFRGEYAVIKKNNLITTVKESDFKVASDNVSFNSQSPLVFL